MAKTLEELINSGTVAGPQGAQGVQGASGGGGGSITGYSIAIGDGSNTTYNVNHSLNIKSVYTSVKDNASGYFVYPDIYFANANAVTLYFVTAPSANQYNVAVLGFN